MGSIYDELWRRRRSRVTTFAQESEQPAPPPARFHTNELSFKRPAALKDKTVQMLAVEDEGPSPFTITIARNTIADDETLNSIAPMLAQHLEQFMQNPTLTEAWNACEIGGVDARQMGYRWRQHDIMLHQRHYLLITANEHRQRVLVHFTATSNALLGFSDADRQLLDELLASVQLRHPYEVEE